MHTVIFLYNILDNVEIAQYTKSNTYKNLKETKQSLLYTIFWDYLFM